LRSQRVTLQRLRGTWMIPALPGTHSGATGYSPRRYHFSLLNTLRARLTNSLVSIFDGDELVAEHSRMHGFKYRYCTDPAHTPD
ncbi:hypothetical protein ACL1G3_13690, partial [Corynebacterium striatum]